MAFCIIPAAFKTVITQYTKYNMWKSKIDYIWRIYMNNKTKLKVHWENEVDHTLADQGFFQGVEDVFTWLYSVEQSESNKIWTIWCCKNRYITINKWYPFFFVRAKWEGGMDFTFPPSNLRLTLLYFTQTILKKYNQPSFSHKRGGADLQDHLEPSMCNINSWRMRWSRWWLDTLR